MRQLIAVGQCGIDASKNANCSILDYFRDDEANENAVVDSHDSDATTDENETLVDIDLDPYESNSKNFDIEDSDSLVFDYELEDMLSMEESDNLYVLNCLVYVGGYLIYTLKQRKLCPLCRVALENNDEDKVEEKYLQLLKRKSRGKLYVPSKSVLNLLYTSHKFFNTEVLSKKLLPRDSHLDELLTEKVIDSIDLLQLFPTLISHVFPAEWTSKTGHVVTLTNLVVLRFFQIRCKSFVKIYNDPKYPISKRNQFEKLLQNLGI